MKNGKKSTDCVIIITNLPKKAVWSHCSKVKTYCVRRDISRQTERQVNTETRKQAVPTQSMNHDDVIMMIMMMT